MVTMVELVCARCGNQISMSDNETQWINEHKEKVVKVYPWDNEHKKKIIKVHPCKKCASSTQQSFSLSHLYNALTRNVETRISAFILANIDANTIYNMCLKEGSVVAVFKSKKILYGVADELNKVTGLYTYRKEYGDEQVSINIIGSVMERDLSIVMITARKGLIIKTPFYISAEFESVNGIPIDPILKEITWIKS